MIKSSFIGGCIYPRTCTPAPLPNLTNHWINIYPRTCTPAPLPNLTNHWINIYPRTCTPAPLPNLINHEIYIYPRTCTPAPLPNLTNHWINIYPDNSNSHHLLNLINHEIYIYPRTCSTHCLLNYFFIPVASRLVPVQFFSISQFLGRAPCLKPTIINPIDSIPYRAVNKLWIKKGISDWIHTLKILNWGKSRWNLIPFYPQLINSPVSTFPHFHLRLWRNIETPLASKRMVLLHS
jgi:hypothetical protein